MQKKPLHHVNLVPAIVDPPPLPLPRVPPPLPHHVVAIPTVLPPPHHLDEDPVPHHLLVQGKWIVIFLPTVLRKHLLLGTSQRLLFEVIVINVLTVPVGHHLLRPVAVVHGVHIVRKSLMNRRSGYCPVSSLLLI